MVPAIGRFHFRLARERLVITGERAGITGRSRRYRRSIARHRWAKSAASLGEVGGIAAYRARSPGEVGGITG
jgi:hypothetical protein